MRTRLGDSKADDAEKTALARGAVRISRQTGRLIRTAPLTCVFLVAFWTIGALTGGLGGPDDELLTRVGAGTDSPLWTVLSSALWAMDLKGYLATTALLLVFGTLAEREFGTLRTAAIFLGSHVVGVFLGLGLVVFGSDLQPTWLDSLRGAVAAGPSIGGAGLVLALTFRMPSLWRRRVRLMTVLSVLVLTLYSGWLEDLLRLSGGVVGLLIGVVFLRGDAAREPRTLAEARVLVGLVVAASALGPVVAMLSPYPNGPLSWYSDVVAVARPAAEDVTSTCASDAVDLCRTMLIQLSYGRFPALVMSLLPALLLLVLAEGLRRGRRFAWWSALTFSVAHAAIVGWFVADAARLPAAGAVEIGFSYGVPILAPLAITAVLLATRRHFTVKLLRHAVTKFWQFTLGSIGLLSALYVFGGFLVRDQFSPEPGFAGLLADLPKRFLPPGYLLGLISTEFKADGFLGTVLFEYTGVVFWLIVLTGLLMASWRAWPSSSEEETAHARDLMRRYGGSSLSYMTTWHGNQYWFTPDGETVIAYRVVATVALVIGDPIGPAPAAAVRGFAEFCQENGWTPCLYSITEDTKDAAVSLGWSAVQVAEDTVVELGTLNFTGKKWQDVRTALNKAAKAGITAEWCTYADAPHAITDQIRAISAEWVADKGLPEMGFTLGGLRELTGDGVRCLLAVDADRTVHGITSWLPVYADGEVVGYTLDFMRRRASGFRGSMEFLIASAALELKTEGIRFLSLSGAPLARLDRGERPRALQRVLDFTGQVLEPVYGFRSLLAFKAKFQPGYRPMYLAYPDPAALPRIANAVGRAYLPQVDLKQGLRLAAKMITRS
ncbi:rhomboid family intramembrane serine protease [Amycolatopsis mongoliensis]|uniref:Rhomboid family intramembrane serine protease n=1 Tax=Amycolatopsis mongoliensis TaxID=715475 RepID=A0A9Y2NDW7_9PSEU|nr:rhomboid family intramembrane serine protease [Amycolatopsis sp. 4-36]WIY01157.1 rhomboid family intramembrane serine protease [Amycolatopsis sp. 4-36]